MSLRRLLASLGRSGASTMEFVLTIPIALVVIFGSVQIGMVFWADAGLQNALGDAARVATLWPRRSNTEIAAVFDARKFGLDPAGLSTPVITTGTQNGEDFVQIQASYQTSINFILFDVPGITLSHTRLAYRP